MRSVGSGPEVGSRGSVTKISTMLGNMLGGRASGVVSWQTRNPENPHHNRPAMETTLHSFTTLFPAQRRIQAFHIHAKKA